ncbi:hypothetical protein [Polaribacter sp. R77954]|uniref:hypothetical protein n=1 Tax=Polaribacter sp. R77954 TaxID=3093870 RepID=UPI0037C8D145
MTKKQPLQVVDTIIDFTAVDTSPSFKICDSIIDKTQKSDCFRTTIHKKISLELQKHQLLINDTIDETVVVDLIINTEGKIIFEGVKSSEKIKNELPELDSIIQTSIHKLPTVFPAIKQRYKVTTKYQLPIRIYLKH